MTARRSHSARKPAEKTSKSRWWRWPAFVLGLIVLTSVAMVLPLRWIDPPTTAFVLRDDSGRIPVLQDWTAWSSLGRAAPLAVVAAEDQRFAEHFGIDVDAMADSLRDAEDGGRLRGASTITQQLVKNLYLWPGRSFVRKGLEAWLAVVTELCLPKQRILEMYLNVIELGPGIYGTQAASRYYFGRSAEELSDAEAALLAAVLPNPNRFRVDAPTDYVVERQRWIASQAARLKREDWLQRIE